MKRKSSQNKFIKIIKMPLRALGKARDFYVRTMNSYADKGTYDGLGWGGPVYGDPMPRSVSTRMVRTDDIDRDLKEFIRAASTGALGKRVDAISLVSSDSDTKKCDGPMQNQKVSLGYCSNGIRNGSVVMAKIEEDDPTMFDDDVQVGVGVDNGVNNTNSKIGLFPRSGSTVVGATRRKTNVHVGIKK